MSKMDEFKEFVDQEVAGLKASFDDMYKQSVEISQELSAEVDEVKLTILEKLKEFVDKELEEIKKDK